MTDIGYTYLMAARSVELLPEPPVPQVAAAVGEIADLECELLRLAPSAEVSNHLRGLRRLRRGKGLTQLLAEYLSGEAWIASEERDWPRIAAILLALLPGMSIAGWRGCRQRHSVKDLRFGALGSGSMLVSNYQVLVTGPLPPSTESEAIAHGIAYLTTARGYLELLGACDAHVDAFARWKLDMYGIETRS
jgi:hypothetical protein